MMVFPWGFLSSLFKGLGSVKRPESKTQSPKCVLTVIKLSELLKEGEGWEEALRPFYAVSPKVLDGWNRYQKENSSALLAVAENRGCMRHGWGHHYLDTINGAKKEARAAAKVCKKLKLQAYWVNCEKHWYHATDIPAETACAFADEFRAWAPIDTLMVFNGFQWKFTLEKGPRGKYSRPMAAKTVIEKFDIFSPMVYDVTRAAIAKKWDARINKWDEIEGLEMAPMVGVGRVDSRDRQWGFSDAKLKKNKHIPGLKDLVAKDKPEWIAFFYGNGAGGALMHGQGDHMPLTELAVELQNVWQIGVG